MKESKKSFRKILKGIDFNQILGGFASAYLIIKVIHISISFLLSNSSAV